MWAGLGQSDTHMNAPTDADGLAEFGVAGGSDRIANPYMLAYHLTKQGWTYYTPVPGPGNAIPPSSFPQPTHPDRR